MFQETRRLQLAVNPLNSAVLYCTVMNCTILYCTVLYLYSAPGPSPATVSRRQARAELYWPGAAFMYLVTATIIEEEEEVLEVQTNPREVFTITENAPT